MKKTPKARTEYTYNDFGMCTRVETFETNNSLGVLAGTNPSISKYEYNVTAASRIFGALISETDSNGVTLRYFYDESDGKLLSQVNTPSNFRWASDSCNRW